MKAYLETKQRLRQPLAGRNQPLKAMVLEVYYGKLHIDCYHFNQKCKDHFETGDATKASQTLFATFIFRGNNNVCWT